MLSAVIRTHPAETPTDRARTAPLGHAHNWCRFPIYLSLSRFRVTRMSLGVLVHDFRVTRDETVDRDDDGRGRGPLCGFGCLPCGDHGGAGRYSPGGRGLPVRRVRSHCRARHYAGAFWSATNGGHLPYESRLELARLWLADFAPPVVRIAAQPLWLCGRDGATTHRHVPDLLLERSDGGFTLIDVKPEEFARRDEVARVFAWTERVCGHGVGRTRCGPARTRWFWPTFAPSARPAGPD